MPIQHAVWRVGDSPSLLPTGRLASEQLLEEMIVKEPGILSPDWMLLGRQEQTPFGGRIDLLAIAPDASLVLIELKRDKTPRDIVAQALDYACWVADLKADRLAEIFRRFSGGGSLEVAFQQRFGVPLQEDALNGAHQIIIAAAELDPSTERIVAYLNRRNIPINVVFFQVFVNGQEQLLSRAWLLDPGETQTNAVAAAAPEEEREPWNGEFYVSFGEGDHRNWDDARRFGYISGGGGRWYSRTLERLAAGDRVWVNVPRRGYVGVGVVTGSAQEAKDFVVKTEQGERPILDVTRNAPVLRGVADDPERTEYFVPVRWLEAVSVDQAVSEVGFFGNQNTVAQPRTPRWRQTVERLKVAFPRWNREAA